MYSIDILHSVSLSYYTRYHLAIALGITKLLHSVSLSYCTRYHLAIALGIT